MTSPSTQCSHFIKNGLPLQSLTSFFSEQVGELLFVDLLEQKVISKVTTDIQVSDLALIQDDDQMSTSLLVSVKDFVARHWSVSKILLHVIGQCQRFVVLV